MMKSWMRGVLVGLVVAGLGAAAQAQCPPDRPCGPGPSIGGNRLIRQGFFGADFRPACRAHDACLLSDRECDRIFYRDMRSACENSTHPMLCRLKAKQFFLGAWLFHSIPKPLRPRISQ